jgi:hypothetical protein
MQPKEEDKRNAENAGLTTRKAEMTFKEKFNAIRDSLNDLASPDDTVNTEDRNHNEVQAELAKLNEDDKPDWVMGIFCKTLQHQMEASVKADEASRTDAKRVGKCGLLLPLESTDVQHDQIEGSCSCPTTNGR